MSGHEMIQQGPGWNLLTKLCSFHQWEEQHRGRSCEDFQNWKRNNDPEYQAHGLAMYLQENGIGKTAPGSLVVLRPSTISAQESLGALLESSEEQYGPALTSCPLQTVPSASSRMHWPEEAACIFTAPSAATSSAVAATMPFMPRT